MFSSYFTLSFSRGTFSKVSTIVSGRRPFAKDNELLNYDYDSGEEWEDEEEGETLL